MALIIADRVQETTTSIGTGAVTLAGAVASYQSFAVVGNGNTTYYAIVGQTGTEWEVGVGTYTASGTTLSRDTVLSSSNAGALVNFSAGTKNVWVDYPASKAVTTDTLAFPPDIGTTTPAAGQFTTLASVQAVNSFSPIYNVNKSNGTSASADLIVTNDQFATQTVYGDFGINSSTYAATPVGPFNDPNGTYIYSSGGSFVTGTFGSNNYKIVTNNKTQLTVDAVGNVGIGTTAPGTTSAPGKLAIVANGVGVGVTTPVEDGTAYSFAIYNSNTNPPALSFFVANDLGDVRLGNARGPLKFYANSTTAERMRIDSAGNVGIGVTVPTQKLEISGDIQQQNANYLRGRNAAGTATRLFGINGVNSLYIGAIDTTIGDTLFVNNGSEQMRLTSAGNVGIGTSSPSSMLSVGAANQFTVSSTGAVVASDLTANSTSQFGRSSANYWQATGGATTKGVQFQSLGADANISQVFQSKGTGAIDLAAGSSGVNISNGGTVTALTYVTGGSGWTSAPTVVISTPTTASGTQATATATLMVQTPTVASGGTGYAVNDVLTVVGGTFTLAATLTVTAVSAGVITAVSTTGTARGTYTVFPTSPVSVTGGTGTGATFTLASIVANNTPFTITNAGSGYVEQPTVTFSGGGGSGAAAYVVVGTSTTIRSLGSTGGTTSLDFAVPASIFNGVPVLRLRDNAAPTAGSAGFIQIQNNNGYAQIIALGAANANLNLASNGSGIVNINTNSTNETTQLRVTHTASAVNFVQVTGAATGNQPTITAQGSDANVIMNIASKGNASLIFNANNAEQFRTGAIASAVNSLQLNGAAIGNSPSLQARGSNTDIDLTLTPKGTGVIQFGTYTASVTAVAGYITIKDAGGTLRKLAVLT